LPEGAASAIGADGELLAPASQGAAAFDQLARTGGR
jgi:hypothetical protein